MRGAVGVVGHQRQGVGLRAEVAEELEDHGHVMVAQFTSIDEWALRAYTESETESNP